MGYPDPSASLNELRAWHNRQFFQWDFVGFDSGLVVVPNNSPSVGGTGRFVSTILITQEADFLVKEITGFAYGPCDANGLFILSSAGSAATDFPNPLNTVFAMRGLSVRLIDTHSGKDWMNNPIPLQLIATPGYGIQFYAPLKHSFLLKRNTTLRLEWANADTKVNPSGGTLMYHAGFLLLKGEKYALDAGV
jgi:hypothetical protein